MGMIPVRTWPWCGHCVPHRHQLSSGFRIFFGGQRQSLEQQRMFAGRNEGWRLQECQEFDHKGPSVAPAQGRRRRRRGRRRLRSPQEVPEWELAVGLAGGFMEALGPHQPQTHCLGFVSTCSSVGSAGWFWKHQILNEKEQKPTQNKDFQSSQVPCQGLVSELVFPSPACYPKQHPNHFSTCPKQKELLSSQ